MNKKYTESGSYSNDNNCPHCHVNIDEAVLEEILDFEEVVEFDCPHCKGRIKGYADFEPFSEDVEYHLIGLKLIQDTSDKKKKHITT